MSFPSTIAKYQIHYSQFMDKTFNNKNCSACRKLTELKILQIYLEKRKGFYFSRPCIRDWPCPFTQHRSEIEKLQERLYTVSQRLENQCDMETLEKIKKEAASHKLKVKTCPSTNFKEEMLKAVPF